MTELPPTPYRISFAAKSDQGKARTNNEDSYVILPEIGVAVVADGMGGHRCGEVASHLAVETISPYMQSGDTDLSPWAQPHRGQPYSQSDTAEHAGAPAPLAKLVRAVKLANSAIFNATDTQPDCAGMGSTIIAVVFYQDKIGVVHVGDSRLYRLRARALVQITEDHSMIQDLMRNGILTRAQAAVSLHKNLLTRALGVEHSVQIDSQELSVLVDDIYLLCSDGLTDALDDAEIENILNIDYGNLEGCAENLVARCNARGGPDNITVALAWAKRHERIKNLTLLSLQ